MKQGSQVFTKGIDRRLAKDKAAADSFYTLQNARIQKRGETGYVVPVDGYEFKQVVGTAFIELVAIGRSQDDLLLLDKLSAGQYKFYIVDTSDFTVTFSHTYTADDADQYRFLVFGPTIFVSPHNIMFNRYDNVWRANDFVSTTPTFTLAPDATTGNLESFQFYWYRVRYVYRDGHTTKTSYPKGVKTDANGTVEIVIQTAADIDGSKADVEIFRSTKGQPFQLIARETTTGASFTFVDNGKPNIGAFDEEVYTWPLGYESHDQVRDRYVRANVDYLDNRITPTNITVATVSGTVATDEPVLPRNAAVKIFVRFRFEDGTESFHAEVGNYTTPDNADRQLEYSLGTDNPLLLGSSRAVKEVAFYAQYAAKQRPAAAVHSFETVEIYNKNLASIRSSTPKDVDHYLVDLEDEKPINPRIFLGYKQVCPQYLAGAAQKSITRIYDAEWDWNCPSNFTLDYPNEAWYINRASDFNFASLANYPTTGYLVRRGPKGTDFVFLQTPTASEQKLLSKYIKKFTKTSSGDIGTVYELAAYEALKRLARRGLLYVKMKSVVNDLQLSTRYANERYKEEWVKVIDIEDTSAQVTEYRTTGGIVSGATQNHLYLVLESDSIYDDIDNRNINRNTRNDGEVGTTNPVSYGVQNDYDNSTADAVHLSGPIYDPLVTFELSAFVDNSPYTEQGTNPVALGNDINQWFYDKEFYSPQAVPDQFDNLIFLGSVKVGDLSTHNPDNTGFIKRDSDGLIYNELASDAIYETLVRKEDLKTIDFDFPNQIVWSESFINNTDASQIRNFGPTNFYNISSQHGPIRNIRAKGNTLFVFCQSGVAAIAVGEVITTQTDQTVRVDSTTLLNSEVWVFRNLNNIAADSVVLFENNLFFYDGLDVWMHTDTWQNITQGMIGQLSGTIRATFDARNKEYRINDGSQSFAYSIEAGIWTGPHTYYERAGINVADEFYTVQSSRLRKNNTGTLFGVDTIPVVIESVANTLGEFSIMKLWRKFYIEATGSFVFKYTKDLATSFFTARQTNPRSVDGVTEIGVADGYKNSRMLTWRIESSDALFKLKGLVFEFLPRLRR